MKTKFRESARVMITYYGKYIVTHKLMKEEGFRMIHTDFFNNYRVALAYFETL